MDTTWVEIGCGRSVIRKMSRSCFDDSEPLAEAILAHCGDTRYALGVAISVIRRIASRADCPDGERVRADTFKLLDSIKQ